MVLVELSTCGEDGLEGLVTRLAEALERILEEQAWDWREDYPLTLRESLRMGLQQQILTGRPGRRPDDTTHRVWVALPEGGLRAWTAGLSQRALDGCGHGTLVQHDRTRQELQAALVQVLGPCLQRAEAASLLPGLNRLS
jgi:hypothetical protein